MRLVSLQPYATDVVEYCDMARYLVGVTHRCGLQVRGGLAPEVLTRDYETDSSTRDRDGMRLALGLSAPGLDLQKLRQIQPDLILAAISEEDRDAFREWAEGYIASLTGRRVAIRDVSIPNLEAMYGAIEEVGSALGRGAEGRQLASRIKGQLMIWADSFFDRSRGKKLVVVSGVTPFTIALGWLGDLARLFSAQYIAADPTKGFVTPWSHVAAQRPDVILIALDGRPVADSIKTIGALQDLAGWEDIPAVKRGEVVFASGENLYRPGPRFLKGAAVLVSALAGLESGYITERDEYFRLRFVELHRHRFL